MGPINVIIWACVIVFVITAILTLLDVSGIYRLPNPEHGKALFKALLLEIVIIAVGGFGLFITSTSETTLDEETRTTEQPPKIVVKAQKQEPCLQEDPPISCITGEYHESN